MKRRHAQASVHGLQQSIRLHSTLIGAEPSVIEKDCAKGVLDDPRVKLAISKCAPAIGVEHLGLQVDSGEDLNALENRRWRADAPLPTAANTTCCDARSERDWVSDPQGVAWETLHAPVGAPWHGEAARAKPVLAEASPGCDPMRSAVPMPRLTTARPPAPCCG